MSTYWREGPLWAEGSPDALPTVVEVEDDLFVSIHVATREQVLTSAARLAATGDLYRDGARNLRAYAARLHR